MAHLQSQHNVRLRRAKKKNAENCFNQQNVGISWVLELIYDP